MASAYRLLADWFGRLFRGSVRWSRPVVIQSGTLDQLRPVGQCDIQDLVDPAHRTNGQMLLDLLWYLRQVTLVLARDDHGFDASPMSGQ